MDVTAWHILYMLWLTVGAVDFQLHRASSIESTSGLNESRLHLVQIAILGLATILWLCFRASQPLFAILLGLVCLHAITGYWDTRVAYPKRALRPLEQHVHSILDVAPWVAAGAVYWSIPNKHIETAVAFEPAPMALWLFAIVPALFLTVLPALFEFRRCLVYRAL
ncbi:hypothetical protein [Xanthomonas arboricola]|uniref:hypothetical protein n=1 Tax=Xanthomonas arboricola TaxID=56448 RepID=UPI001ABAC069|nr:hypothetical protein [Xanthomonas arboricola]